MLTLTHPTDHHVYLLVWGMDNRQLANHAACSCDRKKAGRPRRSTSAFKRQEYPQRRWL